MTDVGDQRRVLEAFTSAAEKRLLVRMCERMPRWVTPDLLTLTGLAGSALIFAGFWLSRAGRGWLALVIAGLVVNWFGDSTDGTCARVHGIERPRYGFFVDHTVDVISEGLVFLGLGVSPYVRFDLASLAYIGYLAMSVQAYVRAFVDGVFRISYSRIGPTELRIVLAAIVVAMYAAGAPTFSLAGRTLTYYDAAVATLAVGLAASFLGAILHEGPRKDPPNARR